LPGIELLDFGSIVRQEFSSPSSVSTKKKNSIEKNYSVKKKDRFYLIDYFSTQPEIYIYKKINVMIRMEK